MIFGVQKIAKAVGEAGCYFLSLCKVAEDMGAGPCDVVSRAAECMSKGLLRPDCFVADPAGILSLLGLESHEVVKAGDGHGLPLDYQLKDGEREILRFERPNPAGGDALAHFVVGSGDGKTVAWAPWPGSLTVAQGRLVSRRIIRRKE